MKDNRNATKFPLRGFCTVLFIVCLFIAFLGSALTSFTHFELINTYSCFFFTVIFLCLSIFFVFFFIKSYNDGEESLKKQKDSFADIRKQQEKIENKIVAMDANIREERYTLTLRLEKHKNVYLKQLTDLRAAHTENLAHFSHSNKKLYGIVKKTSLYSIERIKSMVDEYLKLAD